MNNELIKKIITSNNLPCPEFTFENPLLDKNVAKVLAKSFVKILNLSQRNANLNNSLRLSILEIIRKMCQIEPENHIGVDESITTLLKDVYKQKLTNLTSDDNDGTNKDLDAFLIRNFKDMNINSSYKSSLNPETLQAFNNLDSNGDYLNSLQNDIIHWNYEDNKNIYILKNISTTETSMTEDISVKIKSELERNLLEICLMVLTNTDLNIEELFVSNSSVINIVQRSSDSANCFQIGCSILNYIFVMTNFNTQIQVFIEIFIKNVKQICSHLTISVLYPTQVSHIVVLLDIDLEELPSPIQNDYIDVAVNYLSKMQTESESDLIMLLSHYPKWFNIYYNKKESYMNCN